MISEKNMFYYEKREELNKEWFVIEENENFSFPTHLHRWYEIIFLKEGEMDVIIDGTVRKLQKNDSVFIFPNQTHQLVTKTSSKHKLILLKPELIAHFNAKLQNCIPKTPKKHIDSDAWIELFMSASESTAFEAIKGILYIYCSFFANDEFISVSEKDAVGGSDLMHRIFSFADENFLKSCSLKDLSAHIGYDYSYLSKLFSEHIGISFTEYVNMLRIDRACYLLKNTDLPVLEIAEMCGYGSLRSFNRNFVKQMNMAPRDYKLSSIVYNGNKSKL